LTTERTVEDQELKTAAESSFSAGPDGDSQPPVPDSDPATSTSPGIPSELLQQQLAQKDETISALRSQAAQAAMETQIQGLETENRTADLADSREVENGEMSADEATKRAHERQDAAKEKVQSFQQQSQTEEQAQADYVNSALLARYSYAHEYAKEFGVDPDALMDNKEISSPEEMKLKARELSLDTREAESTGTERFDSGQRGAMSSDIENMSPLEKVRSGLTSRRR